MKPLGCLIVSNTPGLNVSDLLTAVRAYRERESGAIVRELAQFVAEPNDVAQPDQIERNCAVVREMLERRGILTEVWRVPGGRPGIYGRLDRSGAQTTVLLYSHFDGTAVEPDEWHSAPYAPVLRDDYPHSWSTVELPTAGPVDPRWRLFGRSVADSKNALVAILVALDALRASGSAPTVNVRLLLDERRSSNRRTFRRWSRRTAMHSPRTCSSRPPASCIRAVFQRSSSAFGGS